MNETFTSWESDPHIYEVTEAPTGFEPNTSAILVQNLYQLSYEASHRYHGGHGFESCWSLRIFSGLCLFTS